MPIPLKLQKNPISAETCRWKYGHPDVPSYTGNVPGLEFFDAQFFKVHRRLGDSMDPMSRKILEMAYQAIYDAGKVFVTKFIEILFYELYQTW